MEFNSAFGGLQSRATAKKTSMDLGSSCATLQPSHLASPDFGGLYLPGELHCTATCGHQTPPFEVKVGLRLETPATKVGGPTTAAPHHKYRSSTLSIYIASTLYTLNVAVKPTSVHHCPRQYRSVHHIWRRVAYADAHRGRWKYRYFAVRSLREKLRAKPHKHNHFVAAGQSPDFESARVKGR